jgi:NAD(P)-dependent dehydrogenase (short-subunit alcohol dehydrogenase family)
MNLKDPVEGKNAGDTFMGMLEGKSVIVTGAGRGIGRDFALAMAAQGASVVVNDPGVSEAGTGHDAGPAQQVVDEIRAAGGKAVANMDSVAEWASANRIIQCATDSFGRLDVVVNNAGILRDRIFHNMSVEEWKMVIDVHLTAVSTCHAPRRRSSAARNAARDM